MKAENKTQQPSSIYDHSACQREKNVTHIQFMVSIG